jgi:hypothetical protein
VLCNNVCMSNFHQWELHFIYADIFIQIDVTKLIGGLWDFANGPTKQKKKKNIKIYIYIYI